MADWSLPTLSSTYTNFLAEVKSRDTDLALQFDGTTSTNIPTGAIRWTSASNTWQKWTGSAWGALSSTFAFPAVSVTGTSAAQYFGINATGTAGSVANGLFAPASNTLGFTTNATQRIHINSSGDVGIGTASPGYRLDVQGGNARIYAGGGGSSLEIGTGATGNQYAFIDFVGDTTYSDYGLRLIRDNAGANSNSILRHRGTGYLSMWTEDAAPLVFTTNNVERLRVDSSGNVGIGVSGPAQNLHIYSASAYATTRIQSGSQFLDLAHTGSDAYITNTAGATIFYTGGSEKARLTSAGYLGIGTSSPTAPLSVAAGASSYTSGFLNVGDPNLGTGKQLFFGYHSTDNRGYIQSVQWGTGYTPLVLNPNGGNVGIGTTSPGAAFDVSGNIRLSAANPNIEFNNGGAMVYGPAANTLAFATGGGPASPAERLRIDSSGNVGIGTTVPEGLLEVSKAASGTLNGEVILQRTRSNASNTVFLDTKSRRHTAGSTWTGVGMRLQHQVDSTLMGHIEFNSTDSAQDVVIGTANTARFRVASDGSFSSVIPGGSTLYPNYACRAWVNFDGTGTVAIRSSGNVSSITDNGTGDYTVNFTTAMPDRNYSVVTGNGRNDTGYVCLGSVTTPTTSAYRMTTWNGFSTVVDGSEVYVAIFR